MMIRARKNESLSTIQKGYKHEKVSSSYAYRRSGIRLSTGALADEGAKSPDNDMVVALQADATHLDPHVSSNGYSNTITNAMYETLLTFNEKSEVVPLLAKEWSVSDDGLYYTFVLNEGIQFHDGEPFNADAVVAVYERGLNDDSLTLKRSISNWESVTADSEYQVTIKLKEANNTFINKITQVRMVSPKAMRQGKDYLAKEFRRYPAPSSFPIV